MKIAVVCPSCGSRKGKVSFENWKNDIGSCECPHCRAINSYTRSKAGVVKPMQGTSGAEFAEEGKDYTAKRFDRS